MPTYPLVFQCTSLGRPSGLTAGAHRACLERIDQWLQAYATGADPRTERGARDGQAGTPEDRFLAVQRQVVGVLGQACSPTLPMGRGGVKVWKIRAETEPLAAFLWRAKTTPPGGQPDQCIAVSAVPSRDGLGSGNYCC